jgi:Holliday junction DNA helicase RuvB
MIDRELASRALEKLEVDPLGLDSLDKKILLTMIQKFAGGPVGLETLAATVGEEAETLEDVVEPFLLQLGFLQRTPRGRLLTGEAYKHLGFAVPATQQQESLFLENN